MLKALKKIIHSQIKKRNVQREQVEVLSKFSSIESDLETVGRSFAAENEVVIEAIQENKIIDEVVTIEIAEQVVALEEIVAPIELEKKQEQIISLETKTELDSWKSYSEEILASFDSQDFDDNEVIWYSAVEETFVETKSEVALETIEKIEPEVITEARVEQVEEKEVQYFNHIDFDIIEEKILAKFSFIKHENLAIKLNKHLNKENISIQFKLEDKKEIGLINKILPSLVQDLGLNLMTEVFKSKSNLTSFKVVLKERAQHESKEKKKKTTRELHV